MGVFSTTQNFSGRNWYRIKLDVTTSFESANSTRVAVSADVVKYAYGTANGDSPFSNGTARSFNIPNGRLSNGNSAPTQNTADSNNWTFSFTAGSPTNFIPQTQTLWGGFTRFVYPSERSTISVSVQAGPHSLLGSATATISNIPHVRRVTFDASGGTVTTSFIDADSGTNITLPTPTRSGFNFNGWNTTGGTFAGNAGASYNVTATQTLVAQWVTANYTVSFNGNGGTSPADEVVTPGNSFFLPSSTRAGHTLLGWFTASSGGSQVSNPYTPTASITLFAQWTLNTFTINYNANGGTGTTSPTTWTYPTSSGQVRSNNFSRTNFVFAGWATSSGGSVAYNPGDTYFADLTNASGSVTLWAVWTAALPTFSDTTITTTGILGRNISLNADRTVAASPVQGYSIVAGGSGLNPTSWLTINSSGQLSGVPPAVGVYTFIVRANNGGTNNTDSPTLSISIRPAGKRFNGIDYSDFSLARRFDGSTWVDLTIMRRWNGTSWENITN